MVVRRLQYLTGTESFQQKLPAIVDAALHFPYNALHYAAVLLCAAKHYSRATAGSHLGQNLKMNQKWININEDRICD